MALILKECDDCGKRMQVLKNKENCMCCSAGKLAVVNSIPKMKVSKRKARR